LDKVKVFNDYGFLLIAEAVFESKRARRRGGVECRIITATKGITQCSYIIEEIHPSIFHILRHNQELQAQNKDLQADLEMEKCRSAHIAAFEDI